MRIDTNSWYYSPDHDQLGQVIEVQTLWGETTCRVWLSGSDSVVRLPPSRLQPIESVGTDSPDYFAYVAAAARVADTLTHDVLLAPIESSVIPLPHQIRALARATSGERIRYLLADEVGLGKTVEAGLILRELKMRGLVQRTLVLVPRGLVTQWLAEMRIHFNEQFHLVLPADLSTLRRINALRGDQTEIQNVADFSADENMFSAINPWTMFQQVIVPLDSVKPVARRRGWTHDRLADHNRERFEDLVTAGWDLVIVDEAHRLGGSTQQVARYKLGQGLSATAPYILLLSATPHQGKTDAFHRLVSLLDRHAFPNPAAITPDKLYPYVIRTEKRHAIDAKGQPLFKPRHTELTPVAWGEAHREQQLLYDAVTHYVREGYNQAIRDKRGYIGFLMILMQRLVVSSTQAIRATLEKRLESIARPAEQPTLFPLDWEEEWAELDGQEQVDALPVIDWQAAKNERAEVRRLLETASRCEQKGPDAKAESLFNWIYRLQAEEKDPDLKILVFTEFVATQEMLHRFLTDRGFAVVCLNGTMGMEERQRVQAAFAATARILVSTDAGGEGLNLQFCHVVINYDIPWNPMRLEQRIGRVDRIGQTHPVRAINFVFDGSVEHRVREVLEQKLAVIFDEFGIDKTSDVLDSTQAGRMFDEMHISTILHPDRIDETVNLVIARLQEQARDARAMTAALGAAERLNSGEAQHLMAHPLPHWVERMTVSYLRAHGGRAERNEQQAWCLRWPDGHEQPNVVFTAKEAQENPSVRHLNLEDDRIRNLARRLPQFVIGQLISRVVLPGIATGLQGFWSMWRIGIAHGDPPGRLSEWTGQRLLPLFVADSGQVFMPTARHIWDQLLSTSPQIIGRMSAEESRNAFDRVRHAAESQGQPLYDALVQEFSTQYSRDRTNRRTSLAARRKIVERITNPRVRECRLKLLADEEAGLRKNHDHPAQLMPELAPLIILRVEGSS